MSNFSSPWDILEDPAVVAWERWAYRRPRVEPRALRPFDCHKASLEMRCPACVAGIPVRPTGSIEEQPVSDDIIVTQRAGDNDG